MLRRHLLERLLRLFPGLFAFRAIGPPPLVQINTTQLGPSPQGEACGEDVCTMRDACESGDAGHTCQQRDVCEVDQSGDCTNDSCTNDSSFDCQGDACTADRSASCTGDRCVSDSSGSCTNDGGPSCPPEDFTDCGSDFGGECVSDSSGDCENDACRSDSSGECAVDQCISDSSKECSHDACIADSSGECMQDACISDSSGGCQPSDACISDRSGACSSSDNCTSDSSSSCSVDECTSDASGACTVQDGCLSDSSGECDQDKCGADASGYCERDTCVLDKSNICSSDLCRDDSSPPCGTDTCATDQPTALGLSRRKELGLNRAMRWLYQISAMVTLLVLVQGSLPAVERTVIDARDSAMLPSPQFVTGATLTVAQPAGPFLADFDDDGILEADTNGNGLDAADPEVKDYDGDGTRELPAGTPWQGSFEFTYFWVPDDVVLVSTGPLEIKVATDARVFGPLRLAAGIRLSALGIVDVRTAAWLSDTPETSRIELASALVGVVETAGSGLLDGDAVQPVQDADQDGVIDAEELGADTDGDGLPDWQDQDTARVATEAGPVSIDLMEGSRPQLDLFQVRWLGAQDSALPTNHPVGAYAYGFFQIGVVGLEVGETAHVALHFPGPVPNNARYREQLTDGSWRSRLPTSHPASNVIVLDLQDGGPEDGDRQADGKISHLGGIPFVNLFFAHFGEGGGLLTSQIILLNPDRNNATQAWIVLQDDGGGPLTVDLNGETVNGMATASIAAAGLESFQTDGLGPVRGGSVSVAGDRTLAGVILFGGSVGVAGVGVSPPILSGFITPVESDLAEGIRSGLALANLESSEASIRLEYRDLEGRRVASARIRVPGGGHLARFVDELDWDPPLDFSKRVGLLRVTSGAGLAATALQTRPGEFATLPVVAIPSPGSMNGQRLYLAQFGDGGGQLFSQIWLFNLSDELEALFQIELRDDEGQPLNVDLNGQQVAGSTAGEIPPSGLRIFATDGEGPVQAGSVSVTSNIPLGGVLLFGGAVGLAGVGSSQDLPLGFLAPIEKNTAAHINTGVAIANNDNLRTNLLFELLDTNGRLLANASGRLEGRGHLALFVDQLDWDQAIDFSTFRGVLRVTTTRRISATVIQTRPGQFATLPVVSLSP